MLWHLGIQEWDTDNSICFKSLAQHVYTRPLNQQSKEAIFTLSENRKEGRESMHYEKKNYLLEVRVRSKRTPELG